MRTVTRITVHADPGPLGSVEEAARAEASVDWGAADSGAQQACTVCFAALEVAEHLAGLQDVQTRIASLGRAASERSEPESGGVHVLLTTAEGWEACRAALGRVVPAFRDAAAPEAPQGFAVRTGSWRGGGPAYLILGSDRAGTLYGAYELLRALGFRWFSPDEWDQQVPARLPDPLPSLSGEQSPSFPIRGFHASEDRGGRAFLLWMARNRMNLWSAAESDTPLCRKLCILLEGGGHRVFHDYLPPERYAREHPEWYCLWEGERKPELDESVGYNICLSNPEARRTLSDNLVGDLLSGNNRLTDLLNVWPLDNGRWCQCPACRELGNPTDHMMALAGDCCAALGRAEAEGALQRRVWLALPAYHENLVIPSRPLPGELEQQRILVTFFPIERCFAHAFADPSCEEINAELLALWRQWTDNPECPYRAAMMVGEYYNVSSFAALAIPFTAVMAQDIPFYHSSGCRAIHYMHVTTAQWGTLAQTNCLFAALTWNHREDARSFLADFMHHRYGAQAALAGELYGILEEAMRNSKLLKHYAGMARHTFFRSLRTRGSAESPTELFGTKHLRYGAEEGTPEGCPSVLESRELLSRADALMDRLLLEAREAAIRRRLAADARRLRYTRNMVEFLYALIRVRMLENRGDRELASLEALRLRDVGEALRREQLMPRHQWDDSRYGFYTNGLTATWFARAYAELMADYGLETPDTPGGKLPGDAGTDQRLA